MKKIILIASVVFSVLSVNAQKVFNLVGVEKVGNGFYAKATNGEQKPISPYTYKQVKKAVQDYVLVTYDGEVSDWTLAHKSKVRYAVLAVDSIGYDEDNDVAEVFLSNQTVYRSKNEQWLRVNVGQHVEAWYVDGLTKIIEHWHTVPRDMALTTVVPIIQGAGQQLPPTNGGQGAGQQLPPTNGGQGAGQQLPPPPMNGGQSAGQQLPPPPMNGGKTTQPTQHRFVKR